MANEVKIQITADDSQLKATLADTKRQLDQVSSAEGTWGGGSAATFSQTRQQKPWWMDREYVDMLQRAKQAEDAGRESLQAIAAKLRESSTAEDEFAQKSKSATDSSESFGEMLGKGVGQLAMWHFRLLGAAAAVGAVVEVMKAGSAVDTTKFQIGAIVGDTRDWEDLKQISKDTATNITEVGAAYKTLYSLGSNRGDLLQQTRTVSAISKVFGENPNEIAEIMGRINDRAELSFRDVFKITQITGGATRDLAVEYRNLERGVLLASQAMEVHRLQQQKTYAEESRALEDQRVERQQNYVLLSRQLEDETTERQRSFALESRDIEDRNTREERQYQAAGRRSSAMTDVAGKLGVTDRMFDRWKSGGTGVGAPGVSGVFGSRTAGLDAFISSQFSAGLSEMAEQTGVSQGELMYGAQTGKLSGGDFLRYAGERRDRQRQEHLQQQQDLQRQRERGQQDTGFEEEQTRRGMSRQNQDETLADERKRTGLQRTQQDEELAEAQKRIDLTVGTYNKKQDIVEQLRDVLSDPKQMEAILAQRMQTPSGKLEGTENWMLQRWQDIGGQALRLGFSDEGRIGQMVKDTEQKGPVDAGAQMRAIMTDFNKGDWQALWRDATNVDRFRPGGEGIKDQSDQLGAIKDEVAGLRDDLKAVLSAGGGA